MFEQRDIQAYRNIKAPSELKQKITADCIAGNARGNRNIGGAFPMQRFVRSFSAVAACFVLAVAIFSLTRMNTQFASVSYDGATITDSKTAISQATALSVAGARTVEPSGIPLSFDVRGKASITVSGGSLCAVSGNEIVSLGSETEISDDAELWWSVDEGFGQYEMTVTADGKQTVFILELNENTPDGVIYKK